MGQSSSVAVGTTKVAPDASDSCVSGVKLRSTGIIPISELIKQEKCSKNIQKIEKNYYNKNKTVNKQPNEELKTKKVKADFIETSFEDVPARRQWVRINPEPNNPFEGDAIKVGIKQPSKTILNDNNPVNAQNELRDYNRARSHERNRENSRNTKRENTRARSQNAKRENIKVEVPGEARPSTRMGVQKNIGIGTQEFNNKVITRKSMKKTEKRNIVTDQVKKSHPKNNAIIEHKFKESSTQTITRDRATSFENVKQLYKRNDFDEKKRNKNNYQNGKEFREYTKKEGNKIKQQYPPAPQQFHQPPKQYKHHKKVRTLGDFEEESTHQIQTHDISHPKRRSRKYGENLKIETNILCSILPEKYPQWQTMNSNSNANKLGRRVGRNYINRKLAGEYYCGEEKCSACKNDCFNSCDMIQSSVSLLPSASTLEQAIKEHRKYVSAKEALESWKNLHTWKQHRKRFERSRNKFHQDNFDVATQTMFVHSNPKHIARNRSNLHMHLQTHPMMQQDQDDMIVPSEKHLYKDFIVKMEHCLQKHSRLCELNAKRNGEAKYTWVQDKYRRWHKITFDDYKN